MDKELIEVVYEYSKENCCVKDQTRLGFEEATVRVLDGGGEGGAYDKRKNLWKIIKYPHDGTYDSQQKSIFTYRLNDEREGLIYRYVTIEPWCEYRRYLPVGYFRLEEE